MMAVIATAVFAAALSPQPAGSIHYWDAPEVLALPKMSVWVTLEYSPGMSWRRVSIDIGRLGRPSADPRQSQWSAQWRYETMVGNADYDWFEASVPEQTDSVKCPALTRVVGRIQRYIHVAKPHGPEILPDSGSLTMTVYPDYASGGEREETYGVAPHEKGRAELVNLIDGSMEALGSCFSKTRKVYPLGEPIPAAKPIQVGPPSLPSNLPAAESPHPK